MRKHLSRVGCCCAPFIVLVSFGCTGDYSSRTDDDVTSAEAQLNDEGTISQRDPDRSVETVHVQLDEWGDRQVAAEAKSSDPKQIDLLLDALEPGDPTKDHKCGDTGRITMQMRNGTERKIGILAGHDPRYYEYRAYGEEGYEIFRVEREPFLKVMTAIGLKNLDPGSPK